jgi:hypothetical protein
MALAVLLVAAALSSLWGGRSVLWETEILARVPWGRRALPLARGIDERLYGPSDFIYLPGRRRGEGEVVFADPFAERLTGVELPGGRLKNREVVPKGIAALALVGGQIAWVDERSGAVGIGKQVVGRVPLAQGAVLSVLDFQGAEDVGFLLVRVTDASGMTDALYLVAESGLRLLGTGVEAIAVVPGTEEFYFVRGGHLYAPSGRELRTEVPGRLIGADRRRNLGFVVESPRATEVMLWPEGKAVRLPQGPVVVGTRVRLLPDGRLLWVAAKPEGLFLYSTRLVRRFVLFRRLRGGVP